jgi:hypothetical protein
MNQKETAIQMFKDLYFTEAEDYYIYSGKYLDKIAIEKIFLKLKPQEITPARVLCDYYF